MEAIFSDAVINFYMNYPDLYLREDNHCSSIADRQKKLMELSIREILA